MNDEQERRRTRLAALVEKLGSKVEVGRALGYEDGSFVGQMLRGDRPVSEKTVRKAHALPGCRGWFDRLRPETAPSVTPEPITPIYTAGEKRPPSIPDPEDFHLSMRSPKTAANLYKSLLLLAAQAKNCDLVTRKMIAPAVEALLLDPEQASRFAHKAMSVAGLTDSDHDGELRRLLQQSPQESETTI